MSTTAADKPSVVPTNEGVSAVSINTSSSSKERLEAWAKQLAQATDDQTATASASAAAANRLEELDRRIDSGDDTVTAAKLNIAKTEANIAQRLDAAATDKVRKIQRAKPVQPSVAWAISDIVADLLGVSVSVVGKAPSLEDVDEVPSGFLVQSRHTERDAVRGRLKGAVALDYLRSSLHHDLDAEAIQKGLRARGVGCVVHSGGVGVTRERLALQRLKIDVSSAYEETPVIAYPGMEHNADQLAQRLPQQVEQAAYLSGWGKSGQPGPSIAARSDGYTVQQPKIAGNDCTTVVELRLAGWPLRSKSDHPLPGGVTAVVERLRQALETLDGEAVPGLGRCSGVTITQAAPVQSERGNTHAKVVAQLTFKSRLAPEIVE